MDRLNFLKLSLNSGTYKINQCFCNKQVGKKKKPELPKINRFTIELKARQRKIDKANEKFLKHLLRTSTKIDNQETYIKIPDRRPPRKSERELFPNFLMPEELIPQHTCRRKIYLEFSPDAEAIQTYGRLSIILFFDLAPQTCQVFVEHITKSTFARGLPVSRIFTDVYMEFMIVDDSLKNRLDKEPIPLDHSYAGTLSAMYVGSKFRTGSYLNFTISFNPLPHLDGKRQVFGYVVRGADLLKYMETMGRKRGWMKEKLFLSRCGLEQ